MIEREMCDEEIYPHNPNYYVIISVFPIVTFIFAELERAALLHPYDGVCRYSSWPTLFSRKNAYQKSLRREIESILIAQ
jgi:hypothetical protein